MPAWFGLFSIEIINPRIFVGTALLAGAELALVSLVGQLTSETETMIKYCFIDLKTCVGWY